MVLRLEKNWVARRVSMYPFNPLLSLLLLLSCISVYIWYNL